jgi:hypothetical protein
MQRRKHPGLDVERFVLRSNIEVDAGDAIARELPRESVNARLGFGNAPRRLSSAKTKGAPQPAMQG